MEGILDMVARIRERHFSVNSAPWTIGLGKQAITRGNGYKETTRFTGDPLQQTSRLFRRMRVLKEPSFGRKHLKGLIP
jgi:hypothetical protein